MLRLKNNVLQRQQRKAEEERQRVAEEQRKAEAERQRVAEEQRKAEEARKREEAQRQADMEKGQLEGQKMERLILKQGKMMQNHI